MTQDSKRIASNIKAERNRNNFTVRDVSRITGISQQTIMKYERDAEKIHVGVLIKLANLYKCEISTFFV